MNENSRWWEYYTVRYFVGTVVGAGIVAALNQMPGSPFEWLLSSLPEFKDASFKDLALFGAVGFAFCYVASAPILSLHASREHLRLSRISARPDVSIGCLGFALSVSVAGSLYLAPTVPALALAFILTIQTFPLFCSIATRFREVESMYDFLSKARAKGKMEPPDYAVRELIESYRHLREHGNAMAILVLEFVLAFILFNLPRPSCALPVVALWLVPAAFTWLIATVVELRFARK